MKKCAFNKKRELLDPLAIGNSLYRDFILKNGSVKTFLVELVNQKLFRNNLGIAQSAVLLWLCLVQG